MKCAICFAAIATAVCVLWLSGARFARAHNPDPNDPLQLAMPVLKVADIDKTIKYYVDVLGFHEEFRAGPPDKPSDYAGVGRGMVQFHLTTGKRGTADGSVYLLVKDVDKLFDEYKKKGADIIEPIADRPYQMRDFAIKTPDGQILSFGQGIEEKKK